MLLNYGVTPEGNFNGKNVLYRPFEETEFSSVSGLSVDELRAVLTRCKELLFAAREKRNKPFLDDKVLTAWNGLAIQALARAGVVCGESAWVDAALSCVAFIKEHLYKDGKLLKRYRSGESNFRWGDR